MARPNRKEDWEIVEASDFRIIDDALWDAVKRRQHQLSFEIGRDDSGNALNRAHRRKFLLSGLLRCGRCGGGFAILAQDRYGCATRRSQGTCDNKATISRQEIEARVLEGLKDRLMAPELVREFIRAFQEEASRSGKAQDQQLKSDRMQLQLLERKIAGIVMAVEDGRYSRVLGDRLSELESQQEQLRLRLSETPTSVRLHPRLADIYADKVRELERSLNDPGIRDEAAEVLRSMIDRIELHPRKEGNGVDAMLYGDLAEILSFCAQPDCARRPPKAKASGGPLSVVAGARSQRYLHLDHAIL